MAQSIAICYYLLNVIVHNIYLSLLWY
jgi:hypothetical protein